MLLNDYLVTLGLDGFKEYICDKYDECQMKEAIRAYAESQRGINFTCTREEEIDFGGVVEYLCGNFHDDVVQRLTGKTKDIRDRAHADVVAKAVAYAKVNTSSQENREKRWSMTRSTFFSVSMIESSPGNINCWQLGLQTTLSKTQLDSFPNKLLQLLMRLKKT